jgi:hypothetical protein
MQGVTKICISLHPIFIIKIQDIHSCVSIRIVGAGLEGVVQWLGRAVQQRRPLHHSRNGPEAVPLSNGLKMTVVLGLQTQQARQQIYLSIIIYFLMK